MFGIMGLIARFRQKRVARKTQRVAVDAEILLSDLNILKKAIIGMIKCLSKTKQDPQESLFLSGGEVANIVAKASVIFTELKQVERIGMASAEKLSWLINRKFMFEKSREEFKKDLKIEREIEEKALTLESIFTKALSHLQATRERKNLYNFFAIAGNMVDDEIELAGIELGALSAQSKKAA